VSPHPAFTSGPGFFLATEEVDRERPGIAIVRGSPPGGDDAADPRRAPVYAVVVPYPGSAPFVPVQANLRRAPCPYPDMAPRPCAAWVLWFVNRFMGILEVREASRGR
jgi:hypothetical protein